MYKPHTSKVMSTLWKPVSISPAFLSSFWKFYSETLQLSTYSQTKRMDVCSLYSPTLPNTFTVGFQTPLNICFLTAWGVTSQIPYGCSYFCPKLYLSLACGVSLHSVLFLSSYTAIPLFTHWLIILKYIRFWARQALTILRKVWNKRFPH